MEMIRAGPIGDGSWSMSDKHWDEKGKTMISHIYISYCSSCIISIQFGYIENGALVMSAIYGGPSKGHNFLVVKLKQNEYITGLSLCGGINSLIFYTNLGKHGPICDQPVTKYSSEFNVKREIDLGTCDHSKFGGFFGTYNQNCLKSIGIYVSPILSSNTAVKRDYV